MRARGGEDPCTRAAPRSCPAASSPSDAFRISSGASPQTRSKLATAARWAVGLLIVYDLNLAS